MRHFPILSMVAKNFLFPLFGIGGRQATMLREVMPKTSVNKDSQPMRWKHEIRFAEKRMIALKVSGSSETSGVSTPLTTHDSGMLRPSTNRILGIVSVYACHAQTLPSQHIKSPLRGRSAALTTQALDGGVVQESDALIPARFPAIRQ